MQLEPISLRYKAKVIYKDMKVEFVRFKAADNVEWQGWFSDAASNTVVIHILS